VKHNNQKIKFSWDIPSKEHCSFDKVFINFPDMQSMASCPYPSLDDKPIFLVDDQIEVLITIKIMLQTCGYVVNAFNDPLQTLDHFRRHSKNRMISIPADTGLVPASLSPTIIEIGRNTFLELISDKIRNDTAAIRDTIEDSIMRVYSKQDRTVEYWATL
jgi:CheY-like chemotaxis protein